MNFCVVTVLRLSIAAWTWRQTSDCGRGASASVIAPDHFLGGNNVVPDGQIVVFRRVRADAVQSERRDIRAQMGLGAGASSRQDHTARHARPPAGARAHSPAWS